MELLRPRYPGDSQNTPVHEAMKVTISQHSKSPSIYEIFHELRNRETIAIPYAPNSVRNARNMFMINVKNARAKLSILTKEEEKHVELSSLIWLECTWKQKK